MPVVRQNQQIKSYRFSDYRLKAPKIGGKTISTQSGAIHEENKNNQSTIGQ